MLAAAGEFAFTTSTRGDNEKTAVTPTTNVINSGHLYLLTRRNVEACTCLALLNGTDWPATLDERPFATMTPLARPGGKLPRPGFLGPALR